MSRLKKLVLATHNPDKKKEMKAAFGRQGLIVLSLDNFPEVGEIEETGATLLENSLLKARTVHRITGLPAIADDTGLEVDALDGAPGVFSARFAGENATYADNVNKLLLVMVSVAENVRTARFRTVASFVDGDRELWTEGVIEGEITREARGAGGFGFDPIFEVTQTGKTFAEMTAKEKNKISHRGLALRKMRELLTNIFKE
ncbi:MAG TPA: RdgB/HAM1 family non-canonical purine NTP pyrophosphatase [Candidatus Marinimicrobia bacterium]|nr:RdgB/HAM1 family non-canonical purine NTP pyrophosphatase [Candidatus Neomarinimicrobiota bacterium]HIB32089.1 RdgB/HAM1 family non-canonical purine NTP pyrophosphatase [Candidatus Neomarinimicrobiota bacterium]